jgi:hypothetical protein
VGHNGVSEVDRWHALLGFRCKKSRNNCVRIRDTANSEIPMEVTSVEKSTHERIGGSTYQGLGV